MNFLLYPLFMLKPIGPHFNCEYSPVYSCIIYYDYWLGGDNVLVGTYDKKVNWFDMDLSSSAYKNLRFHYDAVRSVDFHKRWKDLIICASFRQIFWVQLFRLLDWIVLRMCAKRNKSFLQLLNIGDCSYIGGIE